MSDSGTPGNIQPPSTGASEDKQSEAGTSTSPDFRQHHQRAPLGPSAKLPPQPHELTAEWTVRAQLTFARAGEKVQRKFSSNDPVNPVRVVYKWSTVESAIQPDDDVDDSSSTTLHKRNSSSRGSRQSTPLKTQFTRRNQHESFRSTTSSANADHGGGDSAFSGSNVSKQRQQAVGSAPDGAGTATAALYGTRCRSTCNIVVSAVADFLPPDAVAAAAAAAVVGNENLTTGIHAKIPVGVSGSTDFMPEEESNPFVFNTTASYTVLPQKSFDDSSLRADSKNCTFEKTLGLRDAFSQTSDTETKFFEKHEQERQRYSSSRSPIERRLAQQQGKSYEQRRAATEGLLQSQSPSNASSNLKVNEGNLSKPSFLSSPSQTLKSASMSRIPPLLGQLQHGLQLEPQQVTSFHQKPGSTEPLKKPRTVHIDVYCTGSEDEGEEEGQADAEASSSSESDDNASKRHDLESNSTLQTVFDNEQLLLRHQRITGQSLPRRLQQHQSSAQCEEKPQVDALLQTEMNVGHAITKSNTADEVSESKQLLFRKHIGDQRAAKLAALRQKYIRQPSDDAISSNYPNSSRSTVRDATCSSVASSIVTSSHADYGDSSWKETEDIDEMYSLMKSDSFEYENSIDRLRIKQMERFWSRTPSDEQTSSFRQGLTGSPVRGHMQPPFLHPISEVSSQRNSPFATAITRPGTLSPGVEQLSESEVFHTYPSRLVGAMPYYQRHLTTPPVTVSRTHPSETKDDAAILQQTSHFPRNRPGFLQFFGPDASQIQQQSEPHSPNQGIPITTSPTQLPIHTQLLYPKNQPILQRWKSETRDNLSARATPSPLEHTPRVSPQPATASYSPTPQRCGSEAPATTTSTSTFFQSPMVSRRFEMKHDSPSVSEASTVYSGYTTEHLEKAKIFGKVVNTVRKPGHHVGPTKNPSCLCESCQRWLAERFQVRSRAFSLGERPLLKRPS